MVLVMFLFSFPGGTVLFDSHGRKLALQDDPFSYSRPTSSTTSSYSGHTVSQLSHLYSTAQVVQSSLTRMVESWLYRMTHSPILDPPPHPLIVDIR